ncbi:hypothetical protein [Sphaerisporangium corydalis]|uniref:Uncharacterized protein n=1 Tax=Sphaerisporangium corydalis TaxID=1441875 RepID=A0ABV9EAN6_9ACTN|nr:hypothetical protein [Sphaerisporangium corydalis]
MKTHRIFRVVSEITLLLVLVAACTWGDKHSEAGAGAVREVQEIGVKMADVKSDFIESDTLVTSRYMVFDLEAPRAEDALRKGADNLRSKGWRVEVDRFPGSMYLISDQLGAAVLLEPLEQAFATGVNEEVKQAAEAARAKAGDPGSLLFVSLEALRS